MEGSIEPRVWAGVRSSSLKELKEAAVNFTVQPALQFCALHVLLYNSIKETGILYSNCFLRQRKVVQSKRDCTLYKNHLAYL